MTDLTASRPAAYGLRPRGLRSSAFGLRSSAFALALTLALCACQRAEAPRDLLAGASRVPVSGFDAELEVIEPLPRATVLFARQSLDPYWAAWHPDGERVAVAFGNRLELWRVDTTVARAAPTATRLVSYTTEVAPWQLLFDASGDRLLLLDDSAGVEVLDVASGAQLYRNVDATHPAVPLDGDRLAFALLSDPATVVVEAFGAPGAPRRIATLRVGEAPRGLAGEPGGLRLAVVGTQSTKLQVFDLATGARLWSGATSVRRTPFGWRSVLWTDETGLVTTDEVWLRHWDPDDGTVLEARELSVTLAAHRPGMWIGEHGLTSWTLLERDGESTRLRRWYDSPVFSPDARWMVGLDDEGVLAAPTEAFTLPTTSRHLGPVQEATYTMAAGLAVTRDRDDHIRVWDLDQGATVHQTYIWKERLDTLVAFFESAGPVEAWSPAVYHRTMPATHGHLQRVLPDGRLWVTHKRLNIFVEPDTGAVTHTFKSFRHPIHAVAHDETLQWFATTHVGKTSSWVEIYDARGEAYPLGGRARNAAFGPDGLLAIQHTDIAGDRKRLARKAQRRANKNKPPTPRKRVPQRRRVKPAPKPAPISRIEVLRLPALSVEAVCLEGPHATIDHGPLFADDGRVLLWTHGRQLWRCDVDTGTSTATRLDHDPIALEKVDEDRVMLASAHHIELRSVDDLAPLTRFLTSDTLGAESLAFGQVRGADEVVVIAQSDGRVSVWDIAGAQLSARWSLPSGARAESLIVDASDRVLTLSGELADGAHFTERRGLTTGQSVLEGPAGEGWRLRATDPTSTLGLFTGLDPAHHVVWDFAAQAELMRLELDLPEHSHYALDPHVRWLAWSGAGETQVHVVDLATEKATVRNDKYVYEPQARRDGLLRIGYELLAWPGLTDVPRDSVTGSDDVRCGALDADLDMISVALSTRTDGTFAVQTLLPHAAEPRHVAHSADDLLLAVTYDEGVLVWDLTLGRAVAGLSMNLDGAWNAWVEPGWQRPRGTPEPCAAWAGEAAPIADRR